MMDGGSAVMIDGGSAVMIDNNVPTPVLCPSLAANGLTTARLLGFTNSLAALNRMDLLM